MFLIFDTETTGLPKRWDAPLTDSDNWPRCIQIAWQVHDSNGQCLSHEDFLIKPDGFKIPYDSEKIHGISTELADKDGVSLEEVISKFKSVLKDCKFICGHNVKFDLNILGAEFYRVESNNPIEGFPVIDTCTEETASFCLLPGGRGGRYKLPTLSELHQSLFNSEFQEAHNATADVEATSRCLFELFRLKIINPEALRNYEDIKIGLSESLTSQVEPLGIKHRDLKKASSKLIKNQSKENVESVSFDLKKSNLNDVPFIHLHTHSQFSVLQSTSRLSELIKSASEDKMLAVGLTDHSNLMGAFNFIKEVNNHNSSIDGSQIPIKPIIGCEFFVCEDHHDKSRRDDGFQIVFLAKNKRGYKNLSIMSSIAYTEGFYYVPRIDKEVIKKHKTDLIVLTGNLYGEIPSKILNISEEQAEESLLWWKEEFGTDLYVEVMRHGQENENRANETLIELSKKHKIKLVATNNSYYTNKREANAHDILLCVKDGEKQSTPIGKGRGYRFGLPNQEYYFKSQNEMKELFSDLPEAIINLKEIYEKVESYDLNREVLLPKFDIPIDFKSEGDSEDNKGENAYLRHLTNIGAEKRYGKISNDIKERLDFELEVIANTGYPGYFLIVQDLIKAARNLGVSVGPGRGSAAGSVVAYCLGITSLDPIKYNLLFERFLNPDRVSMPDIDIDFDDEGRGRVLDYVIKKYGTDQVAQIITYGTMAAKSSIRDTGRVLDLSLGETDRIAKLVPNMKLNSIFQMKNDEMKQSLRGEEYSNVKQLKEVYSLNNLAGETLKQAEILEGSLRNTGTHACGVIITPDDIREFVPITVAKDSDLYVTQYDNSVVEQAGLLKIDFLGLKTLTLIKETVKLIKYNHKIDLDPDKFPLDDQKTFNLFQKGETVGIFQYESLGMRRYLKDLKPNVFDDLIAMNALYRPGPLEYIPSFISRKNGNEEIRYDLPEMEEFLKETYGITVYQEQVMLLSQKLAGFSKGDADLLRKAMGKKIFDLLEKLKPKFIEGGVNNNHAPEILGKIWKDWEAFASYAFNKSHSTCYAWIGYQTAYLKAHYPAEYMAAVLSNNMNDIKQVSFFMEECRRMGIKVLGPDVNESFYKFAVNESGAIRFGMGAIKGVGKTAVETIIENRKDKKYESIFDLVKKVDLRLANKKTFENLAYAGGFDSFQNSHRAQYFHIDNEGIPFIERVLRFGSKYQENMKSSQMNLFGEKSDNVYQVLKLPECEEFGSLERLKNEKEVVGIYISAHPLDDFKKEIELFKTLELNFLKDLKPLLRKTFFVAGIINSVEHLEAKNGNLWGKFVIEDFKDQYEFKIFGEEYLKFRHFLIVDQFIRFKILVREGWTNRETGKVGEPRIQFVKFEMLQNTIRDNSEKITLTIDINKINNDLIEQLKKDLKPFKGDKALFFNVMDHKKSIRLSLESQKGGVDISTEFLTHLDKNNWDYRLN
ncbi:MAG: DNA polymerase III subunit alpha [Flavobacteriaceae bacterium]|nr:DNA polymerase III subunit alpha [Flavobacteriaceae bacterium]